MSGTSAWTIKPKSNTNADGSLLKRAAQFGEHFTDAERLLQTSGAAQFIRAPRFVHQIAGHENHDRFFRRTGKQLLCDGKSAALTAVQMQIAKQRIEVALRHCF